MRQLLMLVFISVNATFAQAENGGEKRFTRSEYIDQWKDEAIFQMVEHGIPASITLAQGILESADGNSELARKANNHFGIKCHSSWQGGKAYHDDDRKGECFRVYPTAHESYEDHSLFLKRSRYSELFDLKITDYKRWARGLKKCGYATDRSYDNRLIDLIEKNNLDRFDEIGLAMIENGEIPSRSKRHQDSPAEEPIAKKQKKNKSKDDHIATVDVQISRAHEVSENRIRYTVAKKGDDFESIAEAFDMVSWQIRKYNDLEKGDDLEAGQKIYLQPKRWKAAQEWHVVQEGETMWDISQKYGVKIRKLYKKNNMERGEEPKPGQKLSLRKNL